MSRASFRALRDSFALCSTIALASACGGQAAGPGGGSNPLMETAGSGSAVGGGSAGSNAPTGNTASGGHEEIDPVGPSEGEGGASQGPVEEGGASQGPVAEGGATLDSGGEGSGGASVGGTTGETGSGGASLGLAPDGESCDSGNDCESGICEGAGCQPGGGTCMPEFRACTRDLRVYCGCDGQTFEGSGSCPGDRYAAEGACEAEGGSGGASSGGDGDGAEGDACSSDDDCASGMCEGEGCDEGGGICASAERICTLDYVEYCGCDGETFGGSGSCPGGRYQSVGACE